MRSQDYRSLFDLDGRRAVVVGAGRGIGAASAHALAAFGADVVCADADLDGGERVGESIRRDGGRASTLRLDATDPHSVAAAAERTGAPDVLVITAAINVRRRALDLDDESFARVVALNLEGSFRLMRDFGRLMAGRGAGSIILFSSIRALVVEPGQAVYAATKAGAVGLVRAFACELGEHGVRVNAVAPGVVETPLTAQIREDDAWREAYAAKTVLGRWASADEIVGAVVFLASDASSYVTGSQLLVDGGWTAADGRYTPPLDAPGSRGAGS